MENFILEVPNALSSDYCDHLINKFESSKHKQPGRTGAGVDKQKKDSLDVSLTDKNGWSDERMQVSQAVLNGTVEYARKFPFILTGPISPSMMDPKTGELRTILHQDIVDMPDEQIKQIIGSIYNIDEVNLQRYTKGEGGYHHWHSEHYPHPADPAQRSLHRVLLWLLYLNDIEEGGETEFFYQDSKVKPKKGSLILAPCGFTHTHRGCVPQSSDKYVLASWVMYLNAGQMYQRPQ